MITTILLLTVPVAFIVVFVTLVVAAVSANRGPRASAARLNERDVTWSDIEDGVEYGNMR